MGQAQLIGAVLLASYLLGSLPFGLWVARKWKGIDVRTVGSGNIGSTNVGRTCGPMAGAIVFVLDVCKGLIPPLVAAHLHLDSRWQILAALLAIVGHNYSIFLKFSGGKGISTSTGALIGIAPLCTLPLFGIFGVTLLTTRWVSLCSICCAVATPLLMAYFYPHDGFRLAFGLAGGGMALYKHRANVRRLRAGTEPKVRLPWTPRPPEATQ